MFVNVREMQLTLTMDDTLSRIDGNYIRNPFLTFKVTFIHTDKTWTLIQGKPAKWYHSFVTSFIIRYISLFFINVRTQYKTIPLKISARADIKESSGNYSICTASLFLHIGWVENAFWPVLNNDLALCICICAKCLISINS